jgi:membrane protein
MDPLAPIRLFDRFQRRHPPLAIPVAVLRGISDQGAGNASVLMAYWAFFSIFPLLLLFSAILGFVLQGHPGVDRSLIHSALQQFPIIGGDLRTLHGSGAGLAIGIVGLIWAGLGVTVATQNAFNRIYAVPHYKQPDFITSRWRGAKFLVSAGLLWVVSTAVSGVVTGGLGGVGLTIAGIAFSIALNLALFFVVFRVLVPKVVATSELWPGIVLAAIGWELLQALGGLYVNHVVRGAGQTYGTFATVIGLLAWLYLGARIIVFAAEINVVLTRGLWPRSLMDPPEPADRKARAGLAKMEERDDKETVEISFHPPDKKKHTDLHHPPYAVAPEPEPGEAARPVSSQIAVADLHTLTVSEVLEAIQHALDEVPASERDKQRAQQWLQKASAQEHDDQAVGVLAEAVERALGLAGR